MERSEIPATRATKDRSAEGTTDTGSVTMMTLKASPFNSRGCFVPPGLHRGGVIDPEGVAHRKTL